MCGPVLSRHGNNLPGPRGAPSLGRGCGGGGVSGRSRSRQLTVCRVVSELERSVSSATVDLQTVRSERKRARESERVRERVVGDLEETERESKGLKTKDLRLNDHGCLRTSSNLCNFQRRRRPGGLVSGGTSVLDAWRAPSSHPQYDQQFHGQ